MTAKVAKLNPHPTPLLRLPLLDLNACKTLIQSGRHHPRWEGLTKERELFIKLFEGPNQQEGVQAFLEKREPEWTY